MKKKGGPVGTAFLLVVFFSLSLVLYSNQKQCISQNPAHSEILNILDQKANTIFQGKFISEKAKWCDEEKATCTIFIFNNKKSIRGSSESIIEIKYIGVAFDTQIEKIENAPKKPFIITYCSEMPKFKVGKNYLIFANFHENPGRRYISAFSFDNKNKTVNLFSERIDFLKILNYFK